MQANIQGTRPYNMAARDHFEERQNAQAKYTQLKAELKAFSPEARTLALTHLASEERGVITKALDNRAFYTFSFARKYRTTQELVDEALDYLAIIRQM